METQVIEEPKAIIFIPDYWESRWKSCVLTQYELDPTNFRELDEIAGYYVSEVVEYPKRVTEIRNCFARLKTMEVEVVVRSLTEMHHIKEEVLSLTDRFSMIQCQNIE